MTIISFDLDGTLVTEDFTQTVWHQGIPELYAKHNGCDLDRARELVIEQYSSVGDDALEWYDIHYWLKHFQLEAGWRDLLGKFIHCIATYPEVHEVLSHLSRNYHLIITSNAAREFLDLEIEKANIAAYFGHVFSATTDFREVKKNPALYLKILDMLNANHAEVIHVGDHHRFDYLVPRELGISSYHLDRSAQQDGPYTVRNLGEFVRKVETAADASPPHA